MVDILADKSWARTLLAGLSVVALCLVAGEAVASYPLAYILALVGVGAVAAVAWWNRGVLTGILVLLLLEGVPFINTGGGSSTSAGANAASDGIFVALVVFLALWALFDSTRNRAQNRIATLAATWASCYFAWWLYKTVAASPGIPVLSAVSYGREFLGFSLFFPLALLGLRRRPHLIGFAITLAIGVAIFSVGQIMDQVAHIELTWLIHISKTNEYEGFTRLYTSMREPLTAAFPMALATTLLGPKAWRHGAMLLTVLTGLANALSFTRATYISEILALFVVSLIWARGTGWGSRRIRHILVFGVVASVFAIALSVIFAGEGSSTSGSSTSGSSSSPVQAIVSRAELGFSNAQNQTGTVAVRVHEANLDLEALGDHWITGLGFLNPAYHWVPGLRNGIHNDDLGSLGILVTMGLVGIILAYMPPITGLIYLLKRRYGFVQYGGAAYLGVALISSITLGPMATLSGLLTLGSILVLCLNWTALEEPTI